MNNSKPRKEPKPMNDSKPMNNSKPRKELKTEEGFMNVKYYQKDNP